MTLLDKDSNQETGTTSQGRRWVKIVVIFFSILSIAIISGLYWRLPLTNVALHKGLSWAGLPHATLNVNAFSASRLRITDIHLSAELKIKSAVVEFNYQRLPGNPITGIILEGVRGDLTSKEQILRNLLNSASEEETTANLPSSTLPSPASLQALLKRAPALPAVTIKDLSLRYTLADSTVITKGTAQAGAKRDGSYAAHVSLKSSGTFEGKPHRLSFEAKARLVSGMLTTNMSAKTADGFISGALSGHTIIASDQLTMNGEIALKTNTLSSASATLEKTKVTGAYRLIQKNNTLSLTFPNALQIGAIGLNLKGTPERQLDIEPFKLHLTGAANIGKSIKAEFKIPNVFISENNRSGNIDDLAISVQHSDAGIEGKIQGTASALNADKPFVQPLLLQAAFSLKKNHLTFGATATMPGSSLVSAKGSHDLSTGAGTAFVSLPSLQMTSDGAVFRALAPFLPNYKVSSGSLQAKTKVTWNDKGFSGAAAANIQDISIVDNTSGMSIDGLTADISFKEIMPLRTHPSQTVTIKKIMAGAPLDNLALRFALVEGTAPKIPALKIESFNFQFASGQISVAPTVVDTEAASSHVAIKVRNIDLSALFDTIGLKDVSGTGRLSGVIPITMAGETVSIRGGRLAAAGPGVLRIVSETVKQTLAQGGPEVALMLSALEDFHYKKLSLKIGKKATGRGRIVLHTKGQNPAVRNGQPFIINLNLSGNVDRIAAVAAQAFQLPSAVVRAMLPK